MERRGAAAATADDEGATTVHGGVSERAWRGGELERARRLLRGIYGHRDFRAQQVPAVEAILAGRDLVAVLPTGAGKSVCFQVPALLGRGLTVVVSPLIALMDDQVTGLRRRGVHSVAALHGGMSRRVRAERRREASEGGLRLLYVAPERLGSPRLGAALGRRGVELIVVDEAHCISQWGHDFRPDYRRIGGFAAKLGRPAVAAFTATATRRVERDVLASLGLRRPVRIRHPVDRPNLHWSVERTESRREAVRRVCERVRRSPGNSILYAGTRRRSVTLAAALRRLGESAAPYHAGLPDVDRRAVQRAFLGERIRAVCATSAFGMGIDHDSVRLVAHLGIPGSLEAYVQEAGRAGRDGRPARCHLVTLPGGTELQMRLEGRNWPSVESVRAVWEAMPAGRAVDRRRLARRCRSVPPGERAGALRVLRRADLVRSAGGARRLLRAPDPLWRRLVRAALRRGRERARRRVERMEAYAASSTCRRAAIARHFGDPPPAACRRCDRCGDAPRGATGSAGSEARPRGPGRGRRRGRAVSERPEDR